MQTLIIFLACMQINVTCRLMWVSSVKSATHRWMNAKYQLLLSGWKVVTAWMSTAHTFQLSVGWGDVIRNEITTSARALITSGEVHSYVRQFGTPVYIVTPARLCENMIPRTKITINLWGCQFHLNIVCNLNILKYLIVSYFISMKKKLS